MIYTVTFNPALDYIVKVNKLKEGETNRSFYEKIQLGGKGINVSFVLAQLGIQTTALGFIGGFTGEELKRKVQKSGICADFINLKSGNTRINVKLKSETETEINANGPSIEQEELELLFEKLEVLKSGDTLVLAGNIPSSLNQNVYEEILKKLQNKGIRFVVDATKDLLKNTLKYKPFLIKPNLQELEEIVEKTLKTEEEIIASAMSLQQQGAQNVLVSLGEKGAILLDENKDGHKQNSFKINAVNTVGAGDSMIAGFLAGIEEGYDYALLLASASGAATASSETLAKKDEIMEILKKHS